MRYLIIDTEKIKGIEYESDGELLDIINNAFLSEEETMSIFSSIWYAAQANESENIDLLYGNIHEDDIETKDWEQFKETL